MTNGGPAFPRPYFENTKGTEWSTSQDGMSLRDWFAGQAMSGMFADGSTTNGSTFKAIAAEAYAMADEMLKTRWQK